MTQGCVVQVCVVGGGGGGGGVLYLNIRSLSALPTCITLESDIFGIRHLYISSCSKHPSHSKYRPIPSGLKSSVVCHHVCRGVQVGTLL